MREARLRLLGHVQISDAGGTGSRMLGMEPPCRRRERPKTRFMDWVSEDMQVAGVTEEDGNDIY